MKEIMMRFLQEEDGDVVQTVIMIAIFAALALLFGNTIIDFVQGLIERISETGEGANTALDGLSS